MALAPYFSKNALAIQHILKKGNFGEFEALLNSQIVEIAFDDAVLKHEGRCCADLLIKLLARLYPKIKVTSLNSLVDSAVLDCRRIALEINPLIEIVEQPPTISVVIGTTPLSSESNSPVFYIGSDGWNIFLSREKPVGCGESFLPFAAGTAACIGAANIFRIVFANLLRKNAVDDSVSFSLLEPYEDMQQAIICDDLGTFHLAGIGAIGNGCLWALSKLRDVKGELIAIDHQKMTLSNIQRYVETFARDKKTQKTLIAARSLKQTTIKVRQVADTWKSFISKSKNYHIEIVLTALDTAKDRIAVQASLPKIILNGYTDDGILGVARHENFLTQACVNCMYTPKGPAPNKSEIIAKDLGVPEVKVRDLIYLNSKVDTRLLNLIAAANNIPVGSIQKFMGVPIETFYHEFVCAGTLLEIKGSTAASEHTVEAPLAFQSALAGVLIAADLYLYKAGAKLKFNRSHYNPLALIKDGRNFTHHTLAKDDTGSCICCDPIYLNIYQKKWLAH